jgi:hypothetical protein
MKGERGRATPAYAACYTCLFARRQFEIDVSLKIESVAVCLLAQEKHLGAQGRSGQAKGGR